MTSRESLLRAVGHGTPLVFITAVAMLASATAQAQQTDYNTLCMGDRAKAEAGINLNCTANDVKVAKADNVVIIDDGCKYPGDTVDFTARMTVESTATERYDIGIYFATDGQGTAMNGGKCTVSTLPTASPFYNLDPSPDTCGDIATKILNPLYPVLTFKGVMCQDRNGNGKLDLPYCTSWRQTGSNDVCTKPSDAYPGAPSKCKCDSTFEITDIDVPPASFAVTKTATPTTVNEPGGAVKYDVTVQNTGIDPANPATLNSLVDNVYGSITSVHGDITSTTCSVPQTIAYNVTYSCYFYANVKGQGGDKITDTVTASGVDSRGNPLKGTASATVTVLDVLPTISVDKSVAPTQRDEPGGSFTFTVVVKNTSVSGDYVTIDTLTDDVYGSLAGYSGCGLPHTLAPGASMSCSFAKNFFGNAGDAQTDTVTASGKDEEGNTASATDSATISLKNVAAAGIDVEKVASPTSINEPGGVITYGVAVQNLSTIDKVTITSLVDDKFGNLNGQGTCSVPQTLSVNDGAPGGSDIYTCSFTATVTGEGNTSHTDVVTASGKDDDGESVSDYDDATVNFINVAPAAALTKTVTKVTAFYEVIVTNESSAESLTLNSLIDDKFGNLAGQGTCTVPQTLNKKGASGDSYKCTFSADVTTTPHTNTAKANVTDNDGSTAAEPSDSATVEWK